MATSARRAERREEPLSRERIVETAVELLDRSGEGGLTFRALAQQLATGPGAIYWHIANKDELLGAATAAVLTGALTAAAPGSTPQQAVRSLALGVFDAIDAHPWAGAQLARPFSPSPLLRLMEGIGRQVQALGVPEPELFGSASALLHYILGVSNQNAANAVAAATHRPPTSRTAFLAATSTAWAELDPDEFAFVRTVAGQMREHDDREEFLTGIDLILTGITARLRAAAPPATGPAREV
ncbi:TetR family transcriptional regulator [Kitasatospora sp. NBC_01246]|uniref:TetR/AcrR family transcriptional regulator n=1 Tax=Kitasatospora sp. NBC_01246 TaxID=2903570 RepID=UPI002E380D1C|nr:TetR family transcriptional regulator [Kitasatospora sp. NBC_01246]